MNSPVRGGKHVSDPKTQHCSNRHTVLQRMIAYPTKKCTRQGLPKNMIENGEKGGRFKAIALYLVHDEGGVQRRALNAHGRVVHV
jgi:hypothetical protein